MTRTDGRIMRAGKLKKLLFLGLLASIAILSVVILGSPAGAQTTTVETVPPEIGGQGRTAADRVDGIVLTLRIIVGVILIGAGVFWWKTHPTRVVRAAIARGELRSLNTGIEGTLDKDASDGQEQVEQQHEGIQDRANLMFVSETSAPKIGEPQRGCGVIRDGKTDIDSEEPQRSNHSSAEIRAEMTIATSEDIDDPEL